MIFTFDFFSASKLPKYTDKVMMVMRQLNNKLFNSPEDLELIADVMRRHLDEHRPKGNTSHISFYKAATKKSGGLYLSLRKDDGHNSDAARLRYVQVEGAIEYDPETRGFFYFNMEDNRLKFHDIIGKEGEPCQQ